MNKQELEQLSESKEMMVAIKRLYEDLADSIDLVCELKGEIEVLENVNKSNRFFQSRDGSLFSIDSILRYNRPDEIEFIDGFVKSTYDLSAKEVLRFEAWLESHGIDRGQE